MQYYANTSAYGPRKAISLVLDLPIDEVELEHDGTGFLIVRPPGANPDPAAVAAQAPPPPEPQPPLMHSDGTPVTDVERLAAASMTVFIDKRREATLFLDKVKGDAHAALVFSGKYDNAAATTEGVKFVEYHTVSLTAFKDCGGHPLAAQRLLTAIMSEGSKSLFDWLNIPAVAAVFENSLTY